MNIILKTINKKKEYKKKVFVSLVRVAIRFLCFKRSIQYITHFNRKKMSISLLVVCVSIYSFVV